MNFIHQVEPYLTKQDIKAVNEYLKSGGWLTEFKKTQEFEESLADFLNVPYAVAVTSGTAALYLALLACGIGRGDKVIVPNYTMIATVNAVKWTGAEPLLIDVHEHNLCLNLERIPLNHNCKALIYVAVNGRSGDMHEIKHYCKTQNLIFIEDAAQALASQWSSQYLGTFSDIGVFSFTPHKIITTGQGGALVTNNKILYDKIKRLKDFDRAAPASDWHEGIGYNFKFTDLQAVIGLAQLKIINFRITRRKSLFTRFKERLKDIQSIEYFPTDMEQTTPWFNDILLPSEDVRTKLITHLKDHGIGARPFYPPINHQKPYSYFSKGSFPVAESLVYRGLWLPSSIGLTDDQVIYIANTIKDFFRRL